MKYFWIGVLMLASVAGKCQERASLEYKLAVTFNPLALAQPDGTFLPGVEYRFDKKMSFMGEAGYIFSAAHNENGPMQRATGFIIRPGLRFYVNAKNNFYLQPHAFYKQVTQQLHDWIGRGCVNGVPSYEELTDFNIRRTVYGMNFTAGKLFSVFSGNGLIDLYFGVGLRYRNRKLMEDEKSCYDENEGGINFFSSTGVLPSLPLGLRLSYILK